MVASVSCSAYPPLGTVNLIGQGRENARHNAEPTPNAYARAAMPLISAQVWKAWLRAARYRLAVISAGCNVIATEVEQVVDLVVGRQEALSPAG